jgi:hypothetical protein
MKLVLRLYVEVDLRQRRGYIMSMCSRVASYEFKLLFKLRTLVFVLMRVAQFTPFHCKEISWRYNGTH